MDEERHHPWMDRALELADIAASVGEVPVGALVVRGDEVLGSGYNRREHEQDPTAHAELVAIREAARRTGSWRLSGCTVYVTLEPCAMCAGAMVLARIDACVFGCTDPKGGFLGTVGDLSHVDALNHHFQVVPGVRADACAERLSAFFRSLRR